MNQQLFHIFRNTPLGRETLLQSLYFCKTLNVMPVIYIPKHTKFLMYFENEVAQIDLDASYLNSPETARQRVTELVSGTGLTPQFIEPKHFTASTLPDIKTDFDFMCCPRSISDLSSKIGLGYIGPRVRHIVKGARFPVLITAPAFKPWDSICVFYGGSNNALNALRLGLRLSRQGDVPLDVFTQIDKTDRDGHLHRLEREGLRQEFEAHVRHWMVFENDRFEDHLYEVPHDALVIMGAFGHGLIRDLVFGNKMEQVQSELSNNLLIVGPKYRSPMIPA